MPLYVVKDVGSVGLVSELDTTIVPENAWTEVKNIRFANNRVEKILGYRTIDTGVVEPYFFLPVKKAGASYWVYAGLDKVYQIDSNGDHTNITRQDLGADDDYTGDAYDLWNGGVFNGVLVLNNGKDSFQMWLDANLESLYYHYEDDPSDQTFDDVTDRPVLIKPYKQFLVALSLGTSLARKPHTVWWSHPADPQTVPISWKIDDPAIDAGQVDLASTNGSIVDGNPLRDVFVIYKEDAIHTMNFVGGQFIMSFREVSRTTGMLAQRCSSELFSRHFVLGNDDIFLFDGMNMESIADKKVRKNIFSNIDNSNYYRSFVGRNFNKNEMWCCVPETGSEYPNIAYVWNWKDGTWSKRDIPQLKHLTYGNAFSQVDDEPWEGDNQPWSQDTKRWSELLYNPASQNLIGCSGSNFIEFDSTHTANGADITSYCVRSGIILGNLESIKRVKAIYPRVTGGPVSVSIGTQFHHNENISWEGPYTFTPGQDYRIPVRATGRIHAIKFQFDGDDSGSLEGYDLDWEFTGTR